MRMSAKLFTIALVPLLATACGGAPEAEPAANTVEAPAPAPVVAEPAPEAAAEAPANASAMEAAGDNEVDRGNPENR